jgi:hypothetical protein
MMTEVRSPCFDFVIIALLSPSSLPFFFTAAVKQDSWNTHGEIRSFYSQSLTKLINQDKKT